MIPLTLLSLCDVKVATRVTASFSSSWALPCFALPCFAVSFVSSWFHTNKWLQAATYEQGAGRGHCH